MCDKEMDAFLERMHKEKIESQKRRGDFNIRKFLFVGALFSVGAAKLPKEIDLALILYIVPFVSICFDLYILGEDYGIKRIGSFIRAHAPNTHESKWEGWVGQRPDPFATYAVPILTILILVACVAVLWPNEKSKLLFWIWLSLNFGTTAFLFMYSRSLRHRLLKDETTVKNGRSSAPVLPHE